MRAFRIAYDGRPFHGFQRQPDVATIEDAIIDALRELDVLGADCDVPSGYAAAGRTDAGVSALAQTVGFEAPDWLTPAAFNSALSADVRAWARADAPDGFHATHDATEREYTYFLHAPDAPLHRTTSACVGLSGRHDYHNLTPDTEGTVRDVTLSADRDGPFLVVRARAGGFARQLVRRLLTVVESVATGQVGPERVQRVLAEEPLPGPEGVPPAPPYPLVLTDVTYPSLSFSVDADAAASAREVFEARAAEWAARARVARLIGSGVG